MLRLIREGDVWSQLAALTVLDEMVEMKVDSGLELLIIRFATAVRILFHAPHSPEPVVMEKASKALGHLARVGLNAGGATGTGYGGVHAVTPTHSAGPGTSGGGGGGVGGASGSAPLSTASLTLTEDLVDFQGQPTLPPTRTLLFTRPP